MPVLIRLSVLILALGALVSAPAFGQETPASAVQAPTQATSAQEPATAAEAPAQSDKADAIPATVRLASDVLIDLLNDPQSRAALIEALKVTAGTGAEAPIIPSPAPGSATAESEVSPDEEQNFALQVGAYTRLLVDEFGKFFDRVGHALNGVSLLMKGELSIHKEKAREAAIEISSVLFAAYLTFMVFQLLLHRGYTRFAARARYGGGITRSAMLVLTTLLDVATVAIGWSVGNFVALMSFGGLETGVTLLESLALNAFFVVGAANAALRFIFAPHRPELRLLPFDDQNSTYWSRRLGFVMYWIGYGVFLCVPLANITVSFLLGNAVRFLTVLIATIILFVLIHRNRSQVAAGVLGYCDSLQSTLAKRAMTSLAGIWHLIAGIYVMAVFIIWVVRPFDATTILLRATGLSIVTIMAAMAISLVMTRAIKGGIRLPQGIREHLPSLQHRLNAFVPRLLKLFRTGVFVATVLLLLDIWGLIDLTGWIASENGAKLLSRYSSAFLVLLSAFVIWLAVVSWVDLRLAPRAHQVVTARERTLFQLFKNAATVVIIVMALLLALAEIGVDIGPLIAGAGVVGLAISFGAQTLVKDIITGAFIQIENAINEGDVVTVAGITGTVERLTVRSVRMRDINGTTHIVPFSSVDMVSNFMRGYSYHVALIGVSYDTDIAYAKDAMIEAFRRLKDSEFGDRIIDDFEMHGVTNFAASSIDIRGRIKTKPGDQWGVGRAYNEFVKQVFDERGIEIPFPQVTYHAATPPAVVDGGRPVDDDKVT